MRQVYCCEVWRYKKGQGDIFDIPYCGFSLKGDENDNHK